MYILIPVLPRSFSVTLGKFVSLLGPQFPHLWRKASRDWDS